MLDSKHICCGLENDAKFSLNALESNVHYDHSKLIMSNEYRRGQNASKSNVHKDRSKFVMSNECKNGQTSKHAFKGSNNKSKMV